MDARILAIETSCDETSIALLTVADGLASVTKELTSTQIAKHQEYGGVVPEVAARMHVEALPLILRELGVKAEDVDAIAVTRGPGLVTSLRVGTDAARTLAYAWGKPLIGVNHIEGHLAANWIGKRVDHAPAGRPGPAAATEASPTGEPSRPTRAASVAATGPADTAQPFSFPAVVLVVSGGHTELILMKDFGQYRLLGATLDDAAGEAFDKVSKMLELGYPGGPVVSKRAALGRPDAFTLPRPMLNTPNFDFSFSGLKTAVLQVVKRKESWTDAEINDLCASFQAAVIETLVVKTIRTVREHDARTVFLAGGVAANKTLRETLKSAVESQTDAMCVLPELAYTTDNAAMIAMAGYFRFRAGQRDDIFNFMPDPNWELGRS